MGVDDECMYLPAPKTHVDGGDVGAQSESESEYESECDVEFGEEDGLIGGDPVLPMANVAYDRNDPPMSVGSLYPNIAEFRLPLSQHAIKNEFEYNIEKSEPGKYRAYCKGHVDGCKWRIHVSRTKGDQTTVQVISLCIFCHLYFIHISDFIILIS